MSSINRIAHSQIQEEEEYEELESIKYKLESLDQKSYQNLFRRRLDEKLHRRKFATTPDHCDYIKKFRHEIAKVTLGFLKKKRSLKPYW